MNRINYQLELEKLTEKLKDKNDMKDAPTLFLHSCCAPCSSYVLEYLRPMFRITVFYFNPNISESEEYKRRVDEQIRLIEIYNGEKKGHFIDIVEGDYDTGRFYREVRGLEGCPEGGERCMKCFELRLRETAERAAKGGFDYFCTTLTISPLKDAQKINETGLRLEKEYGVPWLLSDFKKKNGFKRSVELSREYGLYRQDYCGCVFSK